MKIKYHSHRWLTGTAAGLTAFTAGTEILHAASPATLNDAVQRRLSLGEFAFHHENVLGTSLELIVQAGDSSNARECERQTLAEIERLRRILSTRDSASVISRVQAGSPVESRELAQLLGAYKLWGERTAGAIDVNMAGVFRLWEQAQAAQRLPDAESLANAFKSPKAFNVDALGKGFIVDRAVEVARRFASSGLLNIGGDIRVWGNYAWLIGVADPRNPAENAPLLDSVVLRDAAIATSGGYARYYSIAGKRYSHLIDPRTLRALDRLASATVVAADCLTANALSTAACVLGKADGERLVKWFNAAGYLLADAAQPDVRGGLLMTAAANEPEKPAVETPAPQPPVQPNAWPKDFQITINVQLKAPAEQQRFKRPYVAVWIETPNEKIVRTISIWGNKDKYMSDLSHWFQAAGGDKAFSKFKAISRATRAPGKYSVVWDGLDDQGMALPKGEYVICVEFNREHGHHTMESSTINCKDDQKSVELFATSESEASTIEYGPKQQ